MKKDKAGVRFGVRSIVDFLNEMAYAEMRVGPERVTRRHPAHYEIRPHMIRSKAGAASYMPHEAGHALSAVMREKVPKAFEGITAALEALTMRRGSMASAQSAEEGFAEWVRLYVQDDAAIANNPATPVLEGLLEQVTVRVDGKEFSALDGLKDAARAWDQHQARSPEAQFRSYSAVRPKPSPFRHRFADAIDRLAMDGLARRAGVHHLERKIFAAGKAILAGREVGIAMARRFIAQIRDTPADLHTAYQSLLTIPQEIERAIKGSRAEGGLRLRKTGDTASIPNEVRKILGDLGLKIPSDAAIRHGNWIELTDKPVSHAIDLVGEKNWDAFENYANAKISLQRHRKKKHEYPGWPQITPEALADMVRRYEGDSSAFPRFAEALDFLMQYSDALLAGSVLSGLVSPSEAARMKQTWEHHLPMLREVERGGQAVGGGREGRPSAGYRAARGGQGPIASLLHRMQRRTQDVLQAHYHNRAIMAVVRMTEASRLGDYPLEFRAAVERVAVPIPLERKLVATLSPLEAAKLIADYLNDQAQEQDPQADPIRPEDINLVWDPTQIWRRVAPTKAINVVAPMVNGERQFYQIEDPILFDLFAKSKDPPKAVKFLETMAVGLLAPWKRIITQNLAFSVRNVARDSITAMFLGDGVRGLAIGYHAVAGAIKILSGKAPEGMIRGELLSRVIGNTDSPAHRARLTRFQEVMQEGVVIQDWNRLGLADKIARAPGIAMSAALKPVELALWASGQRAAAQLSEESQRTSAYAEALRAGGGYEAAQAAYAEITGNFGDAPASATIASIFRMPGFLNPTMQINYEIFWRLSHPDPKVRARHWAKAAPFVAVMTAVGWAVNELLTPDEKKKELDERVEEDRLSYMAIGGYLRIPFDYGPLGAVQSLTWNSLDMMAGRALSRRALARLVIKRAMDAPGHPMAFMQPQLQALLENEANYRWHWGDEIEPAWMKTMPVEDRAFWSTPKVYTSMSRWLKEYTGAEVGPLKIQHFVQAGMAYQIDETARFVDRVREGRIEGVNDIPFIGRIFTRVPRGWYSQSVRSVSELDKQHDKLKKDIERLRQDPDIDKEAVDGLRVQMKALSTFDRGMRRIQAMHKEAKALRQGGDVRAAREKEDEMTRYARELLSQAATEF